MLRLEGKVAIITGGARGMGAAHVRKFVEEGAKVVFTDLLEVEGLQLQQELGSNVRFIKQDVSKASEWEQVVDKAEATFGPVNVLVNNAGIAPVGGAENVSEEVYRKAVEVNQIGVFLGMKYVTPSMRKATNGSIINISSTAGITGIQNQISYVATKFAVRGMTKAAALDLAPYGIRVNSVHPGLIKTPMMLEDPTLVEAYAKSIPLQRIANPEEVSTLVSYLASDESSYSTGAEFIVDGGVTAS
ncbi:glucose 1-dehydrogenase [Paenibacillus illinoisensis]|uniref:glucose 1-dehydrogenase n=1 Tax=Paenibacillus illinoisensis TaxID=59845 RepID=UPI003D2735A6